MTNQYRFAYKFPRKIQCKCCYKHLNMTLRKCLDMSQNNHRNQLYILLCKN